MFDNRGTLVISLDFELFWGVMARKSLKEYGKNIENVHRVVPRLLDLFEEYGIHVTWATVGFILANDLRSLKDRIPTVLPNYSNQRNSAYNFINSIDESIDYAPYLFAPDLIKSILSVPYQEIGAHTFSHFYCLEEGNSKEEFKADFEAMIKVAEENNLSLSSLVFPRNQYDESYLELIEAYGIKTFRGNPNHWLYKARKKDDDTYFLRLLRFVDSYINLTGRFTYPSAQILAYKPYNIPSSRFLRAYNPKFGLLEKLKLKRIKKDLTYAAKKGEMYHLWWHPHNFGQNTDENFDFLRRMFDHITILRERYNLRTMNMGEIVDELTPKETDKFDETLKNYSHSQK